MIAVASLRPPRVDQLPSTPRVCFTACQLDQPTFPGHALAITTTGNNYDLLRFKDVQATASRSAASQRHIFAATTLLSLIDLLPPVLLAGKILEPPGGAKHDTVLQQATPPPRAGQVHGVPSAHILA